MREEGEEQEERSQDKVSPLGNSQGETLKDKTSREDILKEIEKDHSKENNVPEIMKGPANPFEEKMKEGVLLAPVEEKHYIEEKPEVKFCRNKKNCWKSRKANTKALTHTKNQ